MERDNIINQQNTSRNSKPIMDAQVCSLEDDANSWLQEDYEQQNKGRMATPYTIP